MTEGLLGIRAHAPELTDRIAGGIELEHRPAAEANVAQQPRPPRPIDDAAADRGEPLHLALVDALVDRDIRRRRADGVLAFR